MGRFAVGCTMGILGLGAAWAIFKPSANITISSFSENTQMNEASVASNSIEPNRDPASGVLISSSLGSAAYSSGLTQPIQTQSISVGAIANEKESEIVSKIKVFNTLPVEDLIHHSNDLLAQTALVYRMEFTPDQVRNDLDKLLQDPEKRSLGIMGYITLAKYMEDPAALRILEHELQGHSDSEIESDPILSQADFALKKAESST